MAVQANMTEASVLSVVRTFLLSILPAGMEVVRGEINRVPEPVGETFIVLWPLGRERTSTNVSSYYDNKAAQAYVANGVTLYQPGQRNVLQPTRMTVQADVHGPSSADNVQTIATLFRDDFACSQFAYGPALDTESGAAIEAETGAALTIEPLDMQPLYTSEPRQLGFSDGENQVEFRWSIDLVLQINAVITVSQQFMDQITVTPIDVDAAYHP